jgi:hypothetical protein
MQPQPTKPAGLEHADSCDYRHCHPDDHGPYCLHDVGRSVTGRTPEGDRLEITLCVATAVRDAGMPVERIRELNLHHTDVIQLRVYAPDDTDMVIDLPPGEFRSLLAIGDQAASVADGIGGAR